MSSSAASGPENALQLVQLKQLVENVAESAYRGLQDLSQAVPTLSDEERYRLDLSAGLRNYTMAAITVQLASGTVIAARQYSKSVSGTQEACSFAAPARHPTEALASARACRVVKQSKATPDSCCMRLLEYAH